MSTRRHLACDISTDGIPSCGTGPGGRLLWVYRELRDAWRDRRHHVLPISHEREGVRP